ncbi:MAG: hypothetical protein FD180_3433 [Planctomycetota bacterium]|nr:MAG: hypothetical protein FD180_3433 [Planctomycetota bacterium]
MTAAIARNSAALRTEEIEGDRVAMSAGILPKSKAGNVPGLPGVLEVC